ncbi:probable transcriptional regulatory protein CCA_00169 [Drosophila obscura]|uniref:probable transcriptional regulatory protein CCA_00169 n=1 Tax=Drosophila obscura TaxID=7282 RepID=UPI001BB13FD1|nr:probable transcriptional regulatory protein CCA_00169 [Drosophila obscura]
MVKKNMFQICKFPMSFGCRSNFNVNNLRYMAGHSKWANIRHIKAKKDEFKSALFAKTARQIRLAILDGNSADPALNPILQSEIDKALRQNMPMRTIQKTLNQFKHVTQNIKKHRLDIRYKRNIYIICHIFTDNFPAVKMDATSTVKKCGGEYVDVGHMFQNCGLIQSQYDTSKLLDGQSLEDRAVEDAIELGAEDIHIVDITTGSINFFCNPLNVNSLSKKLVNIGYSIENCEHLYVSNNLVTLSIKERGAYDIFKEKLRNIPGLEDIYDNVE